MDVLILRLAGPMISFGGPIVDNRGVIQEHPTLSMLAGLIGNALGYRHGEFEKLQSLQDRIRFAARCDKPGERFEDYQTVDLGQDFMQKTGWTTRGEREDRRGGEDKRKGTHLRFREYLADSAFTVALSLIPGSPKPDLDEVKRALERPERPLFLGRKTCLPSTRLMAGRMEAETVLDALRRWPAQAGDAEGRTREAWWPADLGDQREARTLTVADQRDWANQVHAGQRELRHGQIEIEEEGRDG